MLDTAAPAQVEAGQVPMLVLQLGVELVALMVLEVVEPALAAFVVQLGLVAFGAGQREQVLAA